MRLQNKIGINLITLMMMGLISFAGCKDNNVEDPIIRDPPMKDTTDVTMWLTKGDKSALLQRQNVSLLFEDSVSIYPSIKVDDSAKPFRQ